MSSPSPINPYEAPRLPSAAQPDFSDKEGAELADLRRRVNELERRVSRSWVVHPNFLLRIVAVFGYWLLGYALLVAVVMSVMFLVWLLTGIWPPNF